MKKFASTQSLLWQISIPLLIALLAIGLMGALIFHLTISSALYGQLMDKAQITTHSIQFSVESSVRASAIQRYIAALGAEESINKIVVAAGQPLKIIASTQMSQIGQDIDSLADDFIKNSIHEASNKNLAVTRFKDSGGTIYVSTHPTLLTNIKEFSYKQSIGAIYVEFNTNKYTKALDTFSLQINSLFIFILISLTLILAVIINFKILAPQQKILSALSKRKAGDKVFCEIDNNNEVGLIGKAINELFKHSDQVDSLKSQFISTVSHELRTPLTSIRGSLGLLQFLQKQGKVQADENIINIANRNAIHLTNLINDLLDIEKMNDSSFKLNKSVIDIIKVTKESIESMQAYADQHQVSMIYHFSVDSLPVLADQHRIQQVFSNLLSNAIKFSKANDRVVILVITRGNQVKISIMDCGRGIPQEFAGKIFDRFSQADSSDSREKGGTGLGLNIVKTIIEKHGGDIQFESFVGQGTYFYFTLPIVHENEVFKTHNIGVS